MQRTPYTLQEGRIEVGESAFGEGTKERFFILTHQASASARQMMDDMIQAMKALPIKGEHLVFKRFYASDAHTAANYIDELNMAIANDQSKVSLIQQRPLSGTRFILLLYVIEGDEVSIKHDDGVVSCTRKNYEEIWFSNFEAALHPNSFEQTKYIFRNMGKVLRKFGTYIPKSLIRTWLFVNNVDKNYAGVVNARREFFSGCGLNKDSHYVASTGIEGTSANLAAYVSMDALAIKNLEGNQVEYIKALSHLNPTHEYGVTFERASVVNYGDRRHFYLSGTASIDHHGKVVHVGDVAKQTERALENIRALQHSAGFEMDQMAYFIVYLRDIADFSIVDEIVKQEVGEVPYFVVEGPVCRPDWLVEIEGEGIQVAETEFPAF